MQRERIPFTADHSKLSRVDEAIWGHRFREDQTAWLLVLEMMNVANAFIEATEDKNPLPDLGAPGCPEARPHYRIRFRNLLFNFNQKAAELAAAMEQGRTTSKDAWKTWIEYSNEHFNAPGGVDYSPLEARFDDFIQFERAIELVRATAVNGLEGKKGAYSRFLFPMSAESLYWEMDVKVRGGASAIDPTYNSFTRSGTLLHMMLARSSSAEELRPLLREMIGRKSPAELLVKHLQVDELPEHRRSVSRTYLPYSSHPRFDLMGQDYCKILSRNVPANDKFLWLVPLSALHLSLYHAEVAQEYLGGRLPLPVVCEIVAPKTTTVRQQSIDSLSNNGDLSRRAVDKHLNEIFSSDEWAAIVANETLSPEDKTDQAKVFVMRELNPFWSDFEEACQTFQLDTIREGVSRFFRGRHMRENAGVHEAYGKQAGLVSRRATNRNRYAPTDQLLQSLVLANVDEEVPLEEFLDSLFTRYGLVIGSRQQDAVIKAGYTDLGKNVGGAAFRNNQSRLEARLKSMGMLRRLSDSQAYVINPFK